MSSVSSPTLAGSSLSLLAANPDELKQLTTSAFSLLDQSPPPTLREILSAYQAKGDGDRDMLLAMLNAKSAEDQRISSVASLQRTLLEVYQAARHQNTQLPPPPPRPHTNGSHHYSTPAFAQSPHQSIASPPPPCQSAFDERCANISAGTCIPKTPALVTLSPSFARI
ncbi:hypothetical protein LshimejAT787_0307180 [Lyophyllum shimeji]|uniref:Uncharacterized protein n=1 Tax=Lyophyllum shimeji TaxID=47721 RepID=A0A9P3UM71_LYOSH|nr:hypothetical protein LshimejAT787_0307180 [Lyophyllum shimeji]